MDFPILYFSLLFAGIVAALIAADNRSPVYGYFSAGTALLALLAVAVAQIAPPLPMLYAALLVSGCAYFALLNKTKSVAVPVLLVIAALLLGLHILPGLPKFDVFNNEIISTRYPHALSIAGNFDKGIAGLSVLLILMRWPQKNNFAAGKIAEWWRVPVVVGAMVVIAVGSGVLKFDPKWSSHIARFMLSNALLTCAAEEALFRGVVFGYVRSLLPASKAGGWLAILATSVPFALVHSGDVSYLFLVLSVGIGCGWVREYTGSIRAAFVTHASINIIHITLLSYPFA